ncbi:translation initiation factor IF-2 [Anaeromyxobacter sp. K]|uniref:hypothetical protein n=1 Tax=Anaeromyxobacter sp. (strain K) TaxID=447217 RepID=UPI00015F8381|nr:hypothetical protein [Anaeromyxobacter sp. K]ACG73327.1 translation initiation factor IF-2 [Anaeromyxobacter sp. K]
MTVKNRPGAAKQVLAQQRAEVRRSAPGKRFVGDAAAQSREAREAERERVGQMAAENAMERAEAVEQERLEEIHEEALSDILSDLVRDTWQLARTLVSAPFRIVRAIRAPRPA